MGRSEVAIAKMIYIASPYAGDVDRNVEFAKDACRYCVQQGHTPVAVHLLYPQILDDQNPVEREIGLELGLRILERCDELWVCGGRISAGMAREIQHAKKLRIPIRHLDAAFILNTHIRNHGQQPSYEITR